MPSKESKKEISIDNDDEYEEYDDDFIWNR